MISQPRIGYGVWNVPVDLAPNLVKEAIKAGYRHFDCSPTSYNEEAIGKGIRDSIDCGLVKRQELWITTKLSANMHEGPHVEEGIRKSMKKFGLDYFDLYLVNTPHSVVYGDEAWPHDKDGKLMRNYIPIIDTWKEMQKLVEKGLTRHIGVSNFNIELLEKMKYAKDIKIKPYTNEVEMNLYMQQGALIDYLQKQGILLTAFSPLGSNGETLKGGKFQNQLTDPVLVQIAKEIGKTPAQVQLRFLLQVSPIVSVIPKSVTPSRIRENINLDFDLTQDQMQRLRKLERCERRICLQEDVEVDYFGDQF